MSTDEHAGNKPHDCSTGTQQTQFRQNLTQARGKLRHAHHASRGPDELEYRGYTLRREQADETLSGCYEVIDGHGVVVDNVEPSDFHNADDWVRYIDMVIQHGREDAKDWLRNELHWGWSQ